MVAFLERQGGDISAVLECAVLCCAALKRGRKRVRKNLCDGEEPMTDRFNHEFVQSLYNIHADKPGVYFSIQRTSIYEKLGMTRNGSRQISISRDVSWPCIYRLSHDRANGLSAVLIKVRRLTFQR